MCVCVHRLACTCMCSRACMLLCACVCIYMGSRVLFCLDCVCCSITVSVQQWTSLSHSLYLGSCSTKRRRQESTWWLMCSLKKINDLSGPGLMSMLTHRNDLFKRKWPQYVFDLCRTVPESNTKLKDAHRCPRGSFYALHSHSVLLLAHGRCVTENICNHCQKV